MIRHKEEVHKTRIAERAIVCSKCNEMLALFPENEASVRLEARFRKKHEGHMVQVVPIGEINKSFYTVFKPEGIA